MHSRVLPECNTVGVHVMCKAFEVPKELLFKGNNYLSDTFCIQKYQGNYLGFRKIPSGLFRSQHYCYVALRSSFELNGVSISLYMCWSIIFVKLDYIAVVLFTEYVYVL